MRFLFLLACLFCCGSIIAGAQAVPTGSEGGGGDFAISYNWIHTNTQPGKCGCFAMTGATLSGSVHLTERWGAVLAAGTTFASNGPGTGNSITLGSVLGGARYYLQSSYRFHPYAQVLVGVAHAGGGIAGAGDHSMALAGQLGGGIDVPFGSALGLRLLEVDYYPTEFANGTNNKQNNFLVGGGAIYRW